MDTDKLQEMLDQHGEKITNKLGGTLKEFQTEKAAIEASFEEKMEAHAAKVAEALGEQKANVDALLERVKANRVAGVLQHGSEAAHDEVLLGLGKSFYAVARQAPSLIEKADLQEDTGSEGGYTIPTEQGREILRVAKDGGWALQYCRTVPMISKTLTFPVEDAGVAATIIAEEGNIETGAQDNPTFEQATVTAKKFCMWTVLSEELEEDEFVGLGGYLSTIMGEAYAREVDNQAMSGDGTGVNFTGWLSDANVNEVTTIGSLDWDALVDVEAAITPTAQRGARWILNQTNLSRIKKLKDSANMPIWQPPIGGAPGTILGYPYSVDTQMASSAIALGDPRRIVIGQRRGITIARSPHYLFNTAQVVMRMIARTGIAVGSGSGLAKGTGITG